MDSSIEGTLATRRALVRKATSKAAEVKLFNPRFEEDFAAGKDYDPDRYVARGSELCLFFQASAHSMQLKGYSGGVWTGCTLHRSNTVVVMCCLTNDPCFV